MNFDYLFGTQIENIGELIQYPSGFGSPKVATKPMVSPYGPGYSMHPELSRSGLGYLLRTVATNPVFFVPVTTLAVATQIHLGHRVMVESLPESQQQSMWQAIAQGITGGFGVGSATSKYV